MEPENRLPGKGDSFLETIIFKFQALVFEGAGIFAMKSLQWKKDPLLNQYFKSMSLVG